MPKSPAHICARNEANSVYKNLKKMGIVNENLKPMPYGDMIAIPVTEGELVLEFESNIKHDPNLIFQSVLDNPPKKWQILGDMLVLQENTNIEGWPLDKIAEEIGVKKIGIQAPIDEGIMRQSNLNLVFGESGWIVHKENHVEYEFDATKVMYSAGNVTERIRMAKMDMTDEIVIDAYSGIGYYTLQILKHSNAKKVHACDINPDSIEGLRRGLKRNQSEERCEIHQGDNRNTLRELKSVADRVILGLIPSSLNSWGLAINCLKKSGGIIHIHMNVHENEIDSWSEKTSDWFATVSGKNTRILHLEKVKKYSPGIRHVVLDLEIY